MNQSIFRPIYIFDNGAYFLDFRTQKFPMISFNLNPFQHQQALHFGVLNYEKQHKEGTCKVWGRSVVFSAFYADFCFCFKSMIITTLIFGFVLYFILGRVAQSARHQTHKSGVLGSIHGLAKYFHFSFR